LQKSIGSESIDIYRFRLNLNLEAAIENQQASNKAKSIESDPIDWVLAAPPTTPCAMVRSPKLLKALLAPINPAEPPTKPPAAPARTEAIFPSCHQ